MMTPYQVMRSAEHASDVELQRFEDKAKRQEAVVEEAQELVEVSRATKAHSPCGLSEENTLGATQDHILLQQIRDELAKPKNLRIHDSYIVSAIDGFFRKKAGDAQ